MSLAGLKFKKKKKMQLEAILQGPKSQSCNLQFTDLFGPQHRMGGEKSDLRSNNLQTGD